MSKRDKREIQAEALSRARGGFSLANYPAIYAGFQVPRCNAQGRSQVRPKSRAGGGDPDDKHGLSSGVAAGRR